MKIVKVGAMWCPACIKMNKFWNNIKKEYNSVEFIDLDLDMDEDEVKKLNIGSILPEIIIFDNDKELARIIGEKKEEELRDLIGATLE